jgi:hypothetical protein
MAVQPAGDPHTHDEDADGCLCDIDIDAVEMIGDADLPPASGGVLPADASPGDDDEDACDFAVTDPTGDEDLPASAGGVA